MINQPNQELRDSIYKIVDLKMRVAIEESRVAKTYEEWVADYEATRNELIDKLLALVEEREKQTVAKIKRHFETMVFDNTGEDKELNIMEFRKAQSKYLDSLQRKDEG